MGPILNGKKSDGVSRVFTFCAFAAPWKSRACLETCKSPAGGRGKAGRHKSIFGCLQLDICTWMCACTAPACYYYQLGIERTIWSLNTMRIPAVQPSTITCASCLSLSLSLFSSFLCSESTASPARPDRIGLDLFFFLCMCCVLCICISAFSLLSFSISFVYGDSFVICMQECMPVRSSWSLVLSMILSLLLPVKSSPYVFVHVHPR